MKKILSVFIVCITISLILPSCSSKKSYPVTVSGAKLDSGIYSYFLQEAMAENKDVTDIDTIKQLTEKKCAEYVAVNTIFKKADGRLSEEAKAGISDNTKNIWSFYHEYYSAIGVSKQTIAKLQKYLAYKDYLLDYYYGENGIYLVADSKIKDYFSKNYVAFKAINGYLTTVNSDGQTVALSASETEKVKSEFTKMASEMNAIGGPDIDAVNKSYMASQGVDVTEKIETLVLEKNSTSYPSGFFDNVAKMDYKTAYVRVIENYIFLIQRIDASASDDLFGTYKHSCLSSLMAKDFENIIKEEADTFYITSNSGLTEKCYKKISERRSEIGK